MAMSIKSFCVTVLTSILKALEEEKKVKEPKEKDEPEKMRWFLTCSVSAMPMADTLVHGVVLERYKVPDPHKGDPRRSMGGVRIKCRLDNGQVIDRYAVEYKKAKDGVLEYWN